MSTAVPKRKNTIPPWVLWTHQVLLLAGLSFYCFLAYALVRPLFGTFGFDIATTTKTVAAVCLLAVFLLWLFPLADIPLILFHDRQPRARARKGKCPQCGYPRPAEQLDTACSECGASGKVPPTWQPTIKTVGRFAIFLLLAIILGSAISEWQMLSDEMHFQQQASRRSYPQPGDSYTQSRTWPSTYATMSYTLENGAVSDPILGSQRIRKWMRQE